MSEQPKITAATWNLEWATSTSPRGKVIGQLLRRLDPDVLCLTEAHAANFPAHYHVIEAHADYGYSAGPGRRKVLLGSREPWSEIDQIGHSALPEGRFVSGVTMTAVGPMTVAGICIPWRDAHVRTGRKDREPWSDHATYIENLNSILTKLTKGPTIVLGDFNQTVPRTRQPEQIAKQLQSCFSGMEMVTASARLDGRAAIDHIAVSPCLAGTVFHTLPGEVDVQHLSDHFGLACRVWQRS